MSLCQLSNEAENDLIEIYHYGFLNYSENKAELYLQALKKKCQLLASTPYICRERSEFKPPVRIHQHNKHLIVYIIKEQGILIIRVLHERMEVQKYLD